MKSNKDADKKPHNHKQLVSNPIFSKLPELNFLGNQEVVIEGSKGVLQYCTECIRVNTSQFVICFLGRGLNLRCISSSELIIDGFITQVEFLL